MKDDEREQYNQEAARVIRFSWYARALSLLTISLAPLCAHAAPRGKAVENEQQFAAEAYLTPHLHPGQNLGDVVSRTVARHGEGMDDLVWRSSGTGTYTILPSKDDTVLEWNSDVVMEGMLTEKGSGSFRDSGKTMCYRSKCSVSTSASSLIYNPTFWGEVKGELTPGKSWLVELTQPWENGPPGRQTITVLSVDPANGIAILKREGSGEGSYDGDRKQSTIKRAGKAYTVDVQPGSAHWVGQAVFQRGIVVSDELVAERSITYTSSEVGAIHAKERQYMTLTLMPQ